MKPFVPGAFENDFVRKPVTRKRSEKKCSHCKEIKPNDDFYNTITGGLSYYCKPCEDEIAKIIENIESSCITKDELLDIIDSVRTQNNQSTDYGEDGENKDSLDETS